MKEVLRKFAGNTVFANIILILFFLGGWIAVSSMNKEIYPEFSLDMITVSVPWPGAGPLEIEEGINLKIEEALEGLEGIGQVTTIAGENNGAARIEVKKGYSVRKVLDQVRTEIESITTFPEDSEKPVVKEFLFSDPVLQFYVAGVMDEKRMKILGESLKKELQLLEGVSRVDVFGTREYEIGIEVSEKNLREYGLTFAGVSEAIRKSSLNMAGGKLKTGREEIRIKTVERKYTGKELSSVVVLARPDGQQITLDRIATIRDDFVDDPVRASVNGKPALLITVGKTKEEDSLEISESVMRFIKTTERRFPEGVSVNILFDNTQKLKDRLNLLVKNGIMGLIIVFLLLRMFLSARLAFWGSMGIPISVAGAFVFLWWGGGTINMISLFGLIMVMGIIVDDAIIVGEAIHVHREMGKPGLRAVVDGVSEVGMPVFVAVATTITAFVPLLYVGGIMGKFIAILPAVVIACLVVSLVECLFLLPAHLGHGGVSEKEGQRKKAFRWVEAVNTAAEKSLERFVTEKYRPFLSFVLEWRYLSLSVALAVLMLTIGVIKGGFLKFQVFPKLDGYVITATATFPEGTSVAVTEEAMAGIESALMALGKRTKTVSGDPLIREHLVLVGQTIGGRGLPLKGSNYGAVQAILLDSEKRGIHTNDLLTEWEALTGPIPGIKSLTFEGMTAGPPGAPIEIWLQGDSIETIVRAGHELMERLALFDGVGQIRSDHSKERKELRLTLKPEARSLGLTADDLARQVYTGYYGAEALRLQRGHDDIRVRVRYTKDERKDIADFERIRIRTKTGYEVPLTSVAVISVVPGYSTITRTDGMRRIAVMADVDTNRTNANEIFDTLSKDCFPELKRNHPGLSISLQGEKRKMRESLGSLKIGFLMAFIAIFILIAATFRSYIQPTVIMVTVPFGIIGAVAGHLIMGYDLSMMSIFGMVALTGVVVNDAIVLIERVNENLAGGKGFFDALIEAGVRRFRAIFLTTISTAGGLMPLILERDLQAKFLIPMALSIAAGVLFATLLTLVLIPGLLAILNDIRLGVFRLIHGYWPKRLEVEPAVSRYLE